MKNYTNSIPQYLKIRVGGIIGPAYSIRMKDNELLYRVYEEENDDDYREIVINPTDQEWQAFKQTLDEIGVWNWQDEYPNPDQNENAPWFVEIKWGNRKIKSFGESNYPIVDGDPENKADISPTFERFLEAVRKLIGGLKFR